MIMPSSDRTTRGAYLRTLDASLWRWAARTHKGRLDGKHRDGRPPVLARAHADLNIIAPDDPATAMTVRAAIPPSKRHRYFVSLRSSQALAQSVFGGLKATDRLDILSSIAAECGRPAFGSDAEAGTVAMEHEVDTLGEPRPTSIDVLLSGPAGRVAIECKFTETDFGTCSRPRLRPADPSYATQHCDGAYHVQAGRTTRCSLTEIGARYWERLPDLFAWPADRDHTPCPFGLVYQLARNALAATQTPDGAFDPGGGHALVLYDARNPALQAGGKADAQWEAAQSACLVPGLLRRLTWQRFAEHTAAAPELMWLTEGLKEKYGFLSNAAAGADQIASKRA